MELEWDQIDFANNTTNFNKQGVEQSNKQRAFIPMPPEVRRFLLRRHERYGHLAQFVFHQKKKPNIRVKHIDKGFETCRLYGRYTTYASPYADQFAAAKWGEADQRIELCEGFTANHRQGLRPPLQHRFARNGAAAWAYAEGLLHDFPKSELRTVWETSAPKLELSPTAIKYVRMLIGLISMQDYLPNSICAVFYGVAKLAQKIGMPRRSINRAEAELAKAGWIVMSCPKRGRRNGVRASDGCEQIRWAAG